MSRIKTMLIVKGLVSVHWHRGKQTQHTIPSKAYFCGGQEFTSSSQMACADTEEEYFSAVYFPFFHIPFNYVSLCLTQTHIFSAFYALPRKHTHTKAHMVIGFLEIRAHSSLSLAPLHPGLFGTLCKHSHAHTHTHTHTHTYSHLRAAVTVRLGSWQPCTMVKFPTA